MGRVKGMKTNYAIILLILTLAAVLTVSSVPCWAQRTGEEKKEEKKEDIWKEDEPKGPRLGPGRFELTDEDIERIMKSLKESDPKKAKELAKLREKDPKKFQFELRKYGREEFGKIIRERINEWREKRRAEFLEWLGKNYPPEAKKLAKLKEQDPGLYWKKFELIRQKYWRIFEEERRNPDFAEVLKEKLKLKEKRDRLLRGIRAARDEKKRKALISRLIEVVSSRFDLMVREKQIAYERLRKRLEELKKRVEESQAEVDKLMDAKFKKQNVDTRVKELIGQTRGIK